MVDVFSPLVDGVPPVDDMDAILSHRDSSGHTEAKLMSVVLNTTKQNTESHSCEDTSANRV